ELSSRRPAAEPTGGHQLLRGRPDSQRLRGGRATRRPARGCRDAPQPLRRLHRLPRAAPPLDRAHRRRAHGPALGRARGRAVSCLQEVQPAVTAYKFLRQGSIGPFTGFRWGPGRWVEADTAAPCESGVHACRVDDLPYWCNDELWEIELDGSIVTTGHKVAA